MAPRTKKHTEWVPILLKAAVFIDSVVSVSCVPVMLAQGRQVAFPSSIYLVMYQLVYIAPQLVTTLIADACAHRYGACEALIMSLLSSALSMYVLATSLSLRMLPLFIAARGLNGIVRHVKLLFQQAADEVAPRTSEGFLRYAGLYGAAAGFVFSGMVVDWLGNTVVAAKGFALLQLISVGLVLIVYLQTMSNRRKAVQPEHRPGDYVQWLRTWACRGARAGPTLTAMMPIVTCLLAASVTQCMYPLVAPILGMSYTFTGAVLVVSTLVQAMLPAYVLPFISSATNACTNRYIPVFAALVFFVGSVATPLMEPFGAVWYYAVAVTCVDVPASILLQFLTEEVVAACVSEERVHARKLIAHVAQLVKLFSAPLLIHLGEVYPSKQHVAWLVSIPSATLLVAFFMKCLHSPPVSGHDSRAKKSD